LLPNEIFATRPPIVCVEVLSDAVEDEEVEVEEVDEPCEVVSEVAAVDRIVLEEVVADEGKGIEPCVVVAFDFDPPVFDVPSE
jgi:alpha-D-ribose 1-methylphosphonate 5-phosphate C-P lyase